MLTWLICN